jgi:hypothetical protein
MREMRQTNSLGASEGITKNNALYRMSETFGARTSQSQEGRMYLINPLFVNEGDVLPAWKTRSCAKVLCDDFAASLHIQTPQVILVDDVLENNAGQSTIACQSPVGMFARFALTGDIVIVTDVFSPLLLRFVLAHTLAHRVIASTEWVYDLMALDLLKEPIAPVLETSARAIAQIPIWRTRALQFESGRRIVAIGDALTNHAWEDSSAHLFKNQVHRAPTSWSENWD